MLHGNVCSRTKAFVMKGIEGGVTCQTLPVLFNQTSTKPLIY